MDADKTEMSLQPLSGIAAVAPDNGVTPNDRVAPDDGVTPDDRISPNCTLNWRQVAPDDRIWRHHA